MDRGQSLNVPHLFDDTNYALESTHENFLVVFR